MKEKKHCKWYNDEFCTNGDSPCVADYCPVVEYPELCKCREEELENEDKPTYEELDKLCYVLSGEVEHLQEENAKQKAEIEQLTERLDYFQKSSDYHEGNQKELETKNAELQKQVDELKEVGTRVIKEKIPTRCDGCPFCLKRDNKDGTATIDWVCLANDTTRMPMATLHYTDTMHWKHDKCPLISVEIVQQQAVKDTAKEIYKEINEFSFCIVDANKDYEKGYFDAIADYKENVKNLFSKEEYGVEVE